MFNNDELITILEVCAEGGGDLLYVSEMQKLQEFADKLRSGELRIISTESLSN